MTNNAPVHMPQRVVYALRLLYVFIALGIIACLILLPGIAERNRRWVGDLYVLAFFIFGFSAGFVCEIRKGRNWARITFILLFCLVMTISIATGIWAPAYCPFRNIMFGFLSILVAAACALLLQPEAFPWFKAMEDLRRENKAIVAARQLKVANMKDPAELGTITADEPLLKISYHRYKRAWRTCWVLPFCVLFGAVAIWGSFGKDGPVLEWIGRILFAALSIGGLYGLIDLALFDEIRLFKDRIILTRKLRSDREIRLEDAGYLAFDCYFTFDRIVYVFDASIKNKWLARVKGISYFENLMPRKEVEKLNTLLAALSGRKAGDFTAWKVDFPRLINRPK